MIKSSKTFLLSRALTDTELAQLHRFTDPDDVYYYRGARSASGKRRHYLRIDHWSTLPFAHQTLLALVLPCQSFDL